MRRVAVLAVVAVFVTVGAASAGGASSGSTSIKVPLPAPNSVRFALLHFKAGSSFKVSAANAKQLGSPVLNTQAIVTWRKKNGGYDLMVVIHRFTPVNARRLAGGDFVDVLVEWSKNPSPVQLVGLTESCEVLRETGFFDDTFDGNGWSVPDNIVPSNDTNAEEQVDNAVNAKCTGAEKDDPGSK